MSIYIKNYEGFLLENSSSTYKYGCAMVFFDFPQMNDIHSKIDKNDIYIEDGDKSFGLEDEPHVTLLYGIHSDEVSDDTVFSILKDDLNKLNTLELFEVSSFNNDKYDVLKLKADDNILNELNKKLRSLPHTTDYPDYNAHCTLAYLKSGASDKYIKMFNGSKFKVKPNKIVYSKPDGSKKNLIL